MKNIFQKSVIAVFAILLGTFALLLPGFTSDALAGLGGMPTEGWVVKFNVSNLEESVAWYEEKLDMMRNTEFDTPVWTQVFYPDVPNTQIGLFESFPDGSGAATATIVVPDIEYGVSLLQKRGVYITPPCDADKGVALSFFQDPDGNGLALRQNYSRPYPSC
ncbi:MAG: VOC family protein [Cyanobacteria bacterium SBLK]|nr:VOC family protein [Cyanobacteria bacterium SBLK]